MHADDLVSSAQYLFDRPAAERTQADIRRAMSTLYYALFDELATLCANCIAGNDPAARGERAWIQSYRALEHNYSKKQCSEIVGKNFPQEIEDFANCYSTMQIKRHRCDYTPHISSSDTDFEQMIPIVKRCLTDLRGVEEKHQRAFVAFVLLKKRKN